MEPSRGLFGDIEDGILRGRVGARRWLLQTFVVLLLAIGICTMVVVFLLSESLLLFVLTLLVSGVFFASLKFCLQPWAWLGLDNHMPILFDLRSSGLEVGTWDYCFLRRSKIPAASLKDLRVYKEHVDSEPGHGDRQAAPAPAAIPISSSDKVSRELPSCCDASKACVGTCWRSCCASSSSPLVAGCFLAANVEGERPGLLRLTRDVWTLREVEQLLLMATRGRELLGLPEVSAVDLEAPVQVTDIDCGAMTFGKEGLPTISEDAVLREPSAQSTEASAAGSSKGSSGDAATAVTTTVTSVRSGAPRPKMKSQAKVQDLLTV